MTDPAHPTARAWPLAVEQGGETLYYYSPQAGAVAPGYYRSRDGTAAGEAVTQRALTFISLFAGIGGFDLGLERAGMRCVAHVEIDSAARGVLARHWPDVPRFADVRECGAHNLPRADVLCGGFPCQDLSVAGKRAGLAGERSGLFYEMTRIADELRPAFILWENVPGLLSSRGGRDFLAVLMELERIGYCGCWTTLDAQFFGLAQRRQRVFGLFARSDIGAACCAEILSLAARLPWNTETRGAARARVAASVTASAGYHGYSSPRRDGSDNLIAQFDGHSANGLQFDTAIANTLDCDGRDGIITSVTVEPFTFDWQGGVGENDRAWLVEKPGRARSLTAHRTLAVVQPEGYSTSGRGYWREGIGPLPARMGKDAENGIVVGALGSAVGGADDNSAQAGHILAFTERTRAEGRTLETQDDLMYALTNPGSGGRTHSRQIAGAFGVRRLTPLECERLQGFLDGWTEGQSDAARYRQLGNAVAVPVAQWLGARIRAVIEPI